MKLVGHRDETWAVRYLRLASSSSQTLVDMWQIVSRVPAEMSHDNCTETENHLRPTVCDTDVCWLRSSGPHSVHVVSPHPTIVDVELRITSPPPDDSTVHTCSTQCYRLTTVMSIRIRRCNRRERFVCVSMCGPDVSHWFESIMLYVMLFQHWPHDDV